MWTGPDVVTQLLALCRKQQTAHKRTLCSRAIQVCVQLPAVVT